MPSKDPLLTVAIPTYNSAHFLPDAIASIMRQGLDDFELVVVDNASDDNTEEVIHSYRDARVRYIRNETNIGSRENINKCLSNVRGRYVRLLCADDVLLDGVLLKQLDVLQRMPEVALVTCDLVVTNSELQAESTLRFFPGSTTGARVVNACLSGLQNYIGGPSNFMFRRADAVDLKVDADYFWVADLKFGLQLLERGAYFNIGEAGYLYRRHPNSETDTNCQTDIRLPEYLKLVDEFDWWNPLNCLQTLRRGTAEDKRVARRHWAKATLPARMAKACSALPDVLQMRAQNADANGGLPGPGN